MKFVKLNINLKVLFLLSLICLTSLIETKNNIDLSLKSLNRHQISASSVFKSKKKFSKATKVISESRESKSSRSKISSLSKRLKYSSKKSFTKKTNKTNKKTFVSKLKKSSTAANNKIMMEMRRYRAQKNFFNNLTEFFHGLKEKYTGDNKDKEPDTTNMSTYDGTKLKAENFILKTIWNTVLGKAKDFERLVEQVKFVANNPVTALLLKIKDQIFKEDPDYKYAKPEKRNVLTKEEQEEEEEKKKKTKKRKKQKKQKT